LTIAFTGLLCLAVAMGIGRFAFTPLLPMMLHDGVTDLPTASALATANYLGYWLGALGCAFLPAWWARRPGATPLRATRAARSGLVATVLLTLCMAQPWAASWPWWRFLSGVASAVVFVFASGWCLARLTALGRPALSGLIFVGPGLGIALSGLAASAMVAADWRASTAWALFGLLAAALTALAWPQLRGDNPAQAAAQTVHDPAPRGLLAWFALAYGLAGLGYIVTATFLPVIARQALPGSVWLDLFWPLFGAAVAVGAVLTLRLPPHWDRRHLLAGSYVMQAAGVLLTVWWPSLAGFALGSLLLGLPFTAITLFALQESRRLLPHNPSPYIALITAAYGLGQIAGPPMVAWLLPRSGGTGAGFAVSLQVAAAALLAGATIYALLARQRPLPPHR
jgi:MFS family permease